MHRRYQQCVLTNREQSENHLSYTPAAKAHLHWCSYRWVRALGGVWWRHWSTQFGSDQQCRNRAAAAGWGSCMSMLSRRDRLATPTGRVSISAHRNLRHSYWRILRIFIWDQTSIIFSKWFIHPGALLLNSSSSNVCSPSHNSSTAANLKEN